jgi:DNA gyrase subunit A
VRRRTQFRLDKAERRLHLLEGLLIALDAIDLVVSIIRSSQDVGEARSRLIEQLNLSDVQAVHILDMQLRRLTALAKLELETEASELRGQIEDYNKILSSEQRQRTIVLKELEEMVDCFDTPRRSRIISPEQLEDVSLEDVAAEVAAARVEEACVVSLSQSGMIGREPVDGPKPATFGRHDVLIQRVGTTTHSQIWGLTTRGRVFPSSVEAIGEVTGRSRGTVLSELFALDKGESIRILVTAAVAGGGGGGDVPPPLMLVTAQGMMKRISVEELVGTPAGKTAIKLKPGDSIVAAFSAPDGQDVAVIASNAQVMRCEADAVSVQGRGASGVSGMKLSDGATVVGAGAVDEESILLTVTDSQTAKVTSASEIPTKGRATAGLRITKFRTEKRLDWAYVGTEQDLLIVVGTEEAPSKPDASPEPLTIAHTARDLVSKATRRRFLAVGFGRW